ncbi:MAG: serine/threonine protein kinase [bacterium]|nr:serine/threonine protein kinase [bacterium]
MASQQLDDERIFHTARRITDQDARTDYLDQICAGDLALRERVDALLAVHEQEQDFLKSAGPEPLPTVDQKPITEAPGQEIGRYRLLQKIGEGGFGVVFMAEQLRPVRRKVALKVIKPGMDSSAVVARFEAERQALALMDHPNIARVLDGGATDSGRPYFVMELVKGVPITEYCDKNQLNTSERLRLFIRVCQAVQHAHQKGIIHRDLKPSNILVTLHDGKPIIKVIDFGVAKAINQQLTEKTLFTAYGQMVGTPQYMSPEQAEMSGLDVDTRSDVYSLGVILYELLTGSTPLQAERLRDAGYAQMQHLIREEEPPKPSTRLSTSGEQLTIIAKHRSLSPEQLQSSVRGELDWIVMKSLDKERSRRYETPLGFSDDITRFLNNRPVEACSPSSIYRLRKFLRRNRTLVATSGIVTTALLAVTAASLYSAKIASSALTAEQVANARLRELYLREAITAAMNGKTAKSNSFISEGESLDILKKPEIELIRAQQLIFDGNTDEGIRRLESAARELKGSSVIPLALLATARMYANINPFTNAEDNPLVTAEKISETRELTDLEKLFLGQAQFLFSDSEKGNGTLKTLSTGFQSALSDAIRADGLTQRAHDYGNLDDIREALRLFKGAYKEMPDNPYVLVSGIWSHTTAMRFEERGSSEYEQLKRDADEIAQRMRRHMKFPVTVLALATYAREVRDRRQLDECRTYHPEVPAQYIASLDYPEKNSGILDELEAGTARDNFNTAWSAAALASVIAFETDNEQQIDFAVKRMQTFRHLLKKKAPPEVFLLTQSDGGLRRKGCDRALENDADLSEWESSLIQYVRSDELEIPNELLHLSTARFQKSRMYLAAGLKSLLFQDRDSAEEHFQRCIKWPTGDHHWAEAFLRRMGAEPNWRAK